MIPQTGGWAPPAPEATRADEDVTVGSAETLEDPVARTLRWRQPVARSRRVAAAVGLGLGLVFALAPAAVAGAEEPPGAAPTLGAVMDGEVTGLDATATSDFAALAPDADRPAMEVVVEITNQGDGPRAVAVPFGTLLATDTEADQTVAVGGPSDDPTLAAVAASGGTPELTAPPGDSTHRLTVYCTEADDGAPFEPTPLRHLGVAEEPLPQVLRNIAAQRPSEAVAQDAVWWVTDDATMPVPEVLAPLLNGVDTEAFAADPARVVPDTGYAPRWARAGVVEESFDNGNGDGSPVGPASTGPALLVWLLAAAAVAAVVVIARQTSRPRPAAAPPSRPSSGAGRPGWYPDPWGAVTQRWWDGQHWTGQVRPPR